VSWTVRVVADAEAEFEAAARWYDEHAGLRTEFVEAIDEAIFATAEGPQRFPLWRPVRRTASTWCDDFPTLSSADCAMTTSK
jgi:hypothetical protein